MKRLVIAIAFSLCSMSAAAGEPSATLASQDGVVMVNQGEEFVTAADAQALQPGDSVLVMEGASARIDFADGCQLPLESGSMVVVPAQSTCAGGVADIRSIGPSYAQVVGSDTEAWEMTEWLILGGVMVAIGVVAANDDDAPSSP